MTTGMIVGLSIYAAVCFVLACVLWYYEVKAEEAAQLGPCWFFILPTLL